MTRSSDGTIAAIATPPGAGGVGVVRISGADARAIAGRVLEIGPWVERRLTVARVIDPSTGERIDDALVVGMWAPRSYTREDVVEIHAHGGAMNMARVLRAVLDAGARLAEPGEFTRRAFENGALDLARAEAVAAVIAAGSERALRVAQAQLAGSLSERVDAMHAKAVAALAEVEADIDFPEEGLETAGLAAWAERLAALAEEARALAATYRTGRALRDGVDVALVGPPNVGKSSLLNALVGEERALVAPEPGTTRDFVEARVVWNGVMVTLVDTAGDRVAGGVEGRGVELGRSRARRADVIVAVRDASEPAANVAVDAPNVVEIWNKCDLAPAPPGALAVSARTGVGLELLRKTVLARVMGDSSDATETDVIVSERHRTLLDGAAAALRRAGEAARARHPLELVAVDVREGARQLGAITGADVGEDVLDALFARFCIGK